MKKGFTLIELLSVIIILAVIALITTPVVLNLVDNAKKNAFKNSAYGVAKAIEYDILASQLAGNNIEKEYFFPNSGLELKGNAPSGGNATVDSEGRIEMLIHDGKWCATKSYDSSEITIKEYSNGQCGEDGENALYYNQVYSANVDGDNISLVFIIDGTCLMYLNGMMNSEPDTFTVNDNVITLNNSGLIGVISEDGSEINYIADDMNITFTADISKEPRDVYYNQYYLLGLEQFDIDGNIALIFSEDGLAEVFIAGTEDYQVEMLPWLSSSEYIEYRNKIIYIEGEPAGMVSRDGTQIFSQVILTLSNNSKTDSWITIDQTISDSIFTPTFVDEADFTLSGKSIDNHTLSSITISGIEVPVNSDGTWSVDFELPEGEVLLEIVATDTNGETTTLKKYICLGGIPVNIGSSNISIVGYTGEKNEKLVIPDVIYAKNGNRYIPYWINWSAFSNCENLISITLPSTAWVGSDGDGSFYGAPNLQEILVRDDNERYTSVDGVLYSKDMTQLIRYPAGKKGTEYTIPDSVTYLEYNCFDDIVNLEKITISNNIDSYIDSYRFKGCISLKEIIVSENSVNYATVNGVLYSKGMTQLIYYPAGKTDASFTVPEGVSYVSRFLDCNNLKNIILPSSISEGNLDSYVFEGCPNLEEITISSENPYYSTSNGILYNKDMTTLIYYPKGKTVTSIVLPEGITNFNSSAFDVNKVTSITIPSTMTSITRYTFDNFVNLKEIIVSENNPNYKSKDGVLYNNDLTTLIYYPKGRTETIFTFPSSVTTIGEYAFYQRNNLVNIIIPGNVKIIGNSAFAYCDDLTTLTIENGVETIGQAAFYDCDNITSVVIPGSVKTIDASAFADCENLSNLTLQEGIEIIGNRAFAYCYKIKEIVLPSTLKTIGSEAFYGITSVTIPASVESIDPNSFSYSGLKEINIDKNNPTYASKDGVLYSKDMKTLITYPRGKEDTSFTIPNGVEIIGTSAFSNCTKLTNVIIPASVTTISNGAFANCTNLVSINIPNGVTTIGNYSFRNCDSLTSLVIPSSITSINEYAFADCNNLKTVTIEDGVTTIGNYAFENCINLIDINIPSSVNTMGAAVFRNCDSLTSIVIPSSLGAISGSMFYNCDELMNVTIEEGVTTIGSYAFEYCSKLKNIVIPGSVKTIQYGAFANCKGLESVTLEEGVTTIGSDAFEYCDKLTSIVIPSSVTIIEYGAFIGCDSLESLVIPSGVTKIGGYAFGYCDNLKTVTISGTINSLDSQAFYGSNGMETLIVLENVTVISSSLLSSNNLKEIVVNENNSNYVSLNGILYSKDMKKLIRYPKGKTDTSYSIPSGVTTIQSSSFSGCTNLTSITIPSSVSSISSAYYVFDGCTNLTSIVVDENNTTYASVNGVLYSKDMTTLLYYPEGNTSTTFTVPNSVTKIEKYAFKNCKNLTNIIIPSNVTTIESYAFEYCTNLTNVIMTEGVTSIGYRAFANCTSLESIILPNSLTTIGGAAFTDCTNLTSITMPGSVTSLGGDIFAYCTNLETIVIESGVTSISSWMFYGCSKLSSIIIPKTVTTIGSSAFNGCTNLKNVYYTGTDEEWNVITIESDNTYLTNAAKTYNYGS